MSDGVCPDCEMDWYHHLHEETGAMQRRDINFCPVCGQGLV